MLRIKNGKIATKHTTFELPDGFQICTNPINRELGMEFKNSKGFQLSVIEDIYEPEWSMGSIKADIEFIQEDGFYDLIEGPTEVERDGIKGWSCIYRDKGGYCEFYDERYLHKGKTTDYITEIVVSVNVGKRSKRNSVKEILTEPCVKCFLDNVKFIK